MTRDERFARWMAALERRHLEDLRFSEVTRALRALSSAYVERRSRLGEGLALDSAGKRAAFALYYAPLHYLTVREVARALGAARDGVETLVDLGCGTGTGGAAWARELDAAPRVTGIDRHPWAVREAGWTYRTLGLNGRAILAEVHRARLPRRRRGAVLAAYALNELEEATRQRTLDRLLQAAEQSVRVLIIEPIARRVAPWWDVAADRVRAAGGRADEWRFSFALPEALKKLAAAAGLDARELTARSLYITRLM